MSQKSYRQTLPVTAPSAHSDFSKGSLGLYVIIIIIVVVGTSVFDKNHSLTNRTQGVAMAQ